MKNYKLSQKLKLLGNSEFNHLNIILTTSIIVNHFYVIKQHEAMPWEKYFRYFTTNRNYSRSQV